MGYKIIPAFLLVSLLASCSGKRADLKSVSGAGSAGDRFVNRIRYAPHVIGKDPALQKVLKSSGKAIYDAHTGNTKKAIRYFKKILLEKPSDIHALQNLALSYYILGKREMAKLHISRLMKEADDIAKNSATINSAFIMGAEENDTTALISSMYLEVLDKDPDNYWANFNLGIIALKNRNYAGAEKLFQKCIAISPDSPAAKYSMGLALMGQQRNDDAGPFFEQARELDETLATATFYHGLFLNEVIKDTETAAEEFKTIGSKSHDIISRSKHVYMKGLKK